MTGPNKVLFLSFVLLLLFGCKVGRVGLGEDNAFNLSNYPTEGMDSKGVPLKEYNNGIISDFSKDNIANWHGSDKIALSKKNGSLVVEAFDVGREHDRFVCVMHPFRDFTKTAIVKVRARIEGSSSPVLRLDIKDSKGYGTNHGDIRLRIVNCDGFRDYYFDFRERHEQGWPVRHEVDKSSIAELEFFINPGGTQFKGRIYIEKISGVDEHELAAEIEKSKSLAGCNVSVSDNFKNGIKDWGTNSNKYDLHYTEGALQIKAHGSGLGYESFGRSFSAVDMSKNPIIRIKAKTEGKEAVELRLDLVDMEGHATNGKEITKTISNDGKYADYYFNFKNKLYQGWPETKPVNSARISEIMMFINPGGPEYYGNVFISEIELVTEEKKTIVLWNKAISGSDTTDIPILLPGADIVTWWRGNESLKINKTSNALVVKADQSQIKESVFGTGFDIIDFAKHPVLKVVMKTEGQEPANLRINLYDADGITTNSFPLFKEITPDGEYASYYFDFPNNLKQENPVEIPADLTKINGLTFHINKEKGSYKGKIFIKEILAISKNHLNKELLIK